MKDLTVQELDEVIPNLYRESQCVSGSCTSCRTYAVLMDSSVCQSKFSDLISSAVMDHGKLDLRLLLSQCQDFFVMGIVAGMTVSKVRQLQEIAGYKAHD